MRGDFSRLRFEPKQHYTSVVQQQGRVQLDADSNEQRIIDEHLHQVETVDVIGADGAPFHNPGFAVTLNTAGTALTIGAGRYYVAGLLCENQQAVDYAHQPFLVGVNPGIDVLLRDLRGGRTSSLRLWLEAWQRIVTPIDDPCLREPALGEADTTLRLQTVWRLIAEPVLAATVAGNVAPAAPANCCADMRNVRQLFVISGTMSAQTSADPGQGSCLPSPHAAYRGLENQLYRVEIHQGGAAAQTTFKWSRENGSVVTGITGVSGNTVTVESLGPDANLGFAAEQWVEITDDRDEFGATPNQPGALVQIKSIDPTHNQITLYQVAPAVDVTGGHAKLRRWDQASAKATVNGLPLNTAGWQELENGVEVQFSATGTFAAGDYWLIPARAATGEIEWPPCGSDGAAFQAPHRTKVQRAPIACIHFNAQKRSFVPDDCRNLFRPLTELTPPAIPSALHVTAISWPNDDVMTLDQFLFKGLNVTFDQAPALPVDSRNFLVTLEVLLPVEQQSERQVLAVGFAGVGAARGPVVLDGATQLVGTSVTWMVPQDVWLYLDLALNASLDLANQGVFARARVVLKSRAIMQGAGANVIYLDGQCFGTPSTRADKTTPRVDLQLPSGNQEKASDFESWFYVAPVVLISSFTIQPASVAVVRDPATGANKVVDNSNNQPNPASAAVVPTATLVLNYRALSDTVVALSLVNSTINNVIQFPATVTVPKGASQQTFPVNVVGNPGATAVKFDITARITAASGFVASSTVELTVTGYTPIQRTITPIDSGLLIQNLGSIGKG